MIDHVLIYVTDLAESKSFYEKSFASFGYSFAFGEAGKFCSFDIGNGSLFEIAQSKEVGYITPCHIAFRANSKEQVDSFYKLAIEAGAKCNGKPGPRRQYTENYYAAFIIDPNGHNIEAVFDSKP